MTAAEGWRRLAEVLAARREAPPLLPERPWIAPSGVDLVGLARECSMPMALRLAAVVLADRPREALGEAVAEPEALLWQAVARRRAGEFREARRCFRALGGWPFYPRLHQDALALLAAPGPGFRWAVGAAAHLAARGTWDPVWFVDACAAVHSGLLSRETAALLEEIQRVELRLLLVEGAAS